LIVAVGLMRTPEQLVILMVAVGDDRRGFLINRLAGLDYPLWYRVREATSSVVDHCLGCRHTGDRRVGHAVRHAHMAAKDDQTKDATAALTAKPRAANGIRRAAAY
jgi:hypothetical protein